MVRYGNNWGMGGRMGHGYALLCMTFCFFAFTITTTLLLLPLASGSFRAQGSGRDAFSKREKIGFFFLGRMGKEGWRGSSFTTLV